LRRKTRQTLYGPFKVWFPPPRDVLAGQTTGEKEEEGPASYLPLVGKKERKSEKKGHPVTCSYAPNEGKEGGRRRATGKVKGKGKGPTQFHPAKKKPSRKPPIDPTGPPALRGGLPGQSPSAGFKG